MRALAAATFSFAILLRIIIGFHPHSGQDDYQGPTVGIASDPVKYGGDYEAQVNRQTCIWSYDLSTGVNECFLVERHVSVTGWR